MTVYVDALFTAKKRNREGFRWCHMTATTARELHAFAEKIGVKKCWHHAAHYDLWPTARAAAVAAGAVEVSRKDMARLRRECMENGPTLRLVQRCGDRAVAELSLPDVMLVQ